MKGYHSAKKILEILRKEGFVAYFAGGWVRDYLMGHPSADVDIATDAPPEKILRLFRRTIPVGINFGVVVVLMDDHQFEVSTFRKDLEHEDGRRPSKIKLTNEEEDAFRRDFTINGMFFDPFEDRVIDYVGGQEDLKKGIVRAIGNPQERFKEDRLRMIRAIRFAFRFKYQIEAETRLAIKENAHTLFPAVSMERIWQEFKKMAEFPHCDQAVLEMFQLNLLTVIFPKIKDVSYDEIQRRVASYAFFPKNCPSVVFFTELFPAETADSLIKICQYLKVSNKDQKFVAYVEVIRSCAEGKRRSEDVDWAKLYANPACDMAFEVVAARLPDAERTQFLHIHQKRKQLLQLHIERIKNRTPLVTSEDLQLEGITPGKTMGHLLQEAERMAINRNSNNKSEILNLLKQNESWPQ